jgi:hypothetical protein
MLLYKYRVEENSPFKYVSTKNKPTGSISLQPAIGLAMGKTLGLAVGKEVPAP